MGIFRGEYYIIMKNEEIKISFLDRLMALDYYTKLYIAIGLVVSILLLYTLISSTRTSSNKSTETVDEVVVKEVEETEEILELKTDIKKGYFTIAKDFVVNLLDGIIDTAINFMENHRTFNRIILLSTSVTSLYLISKALKDYNYTMALLTNLSAAVNRTSATNESLKIKKEAKILEETKKDLEKEEAKENKNVDKIKELTQKIKSIENNLTELNKE